MNDSLVDRLVDGELSPSQEREFLSQLDDEPGGWRRLALGFVEARVWRVELAESVTRPASRRVHPGGPTTPAGPRSRLFAIAAAIALAFGVGFIIRGSASRPMRNNDVVTAAPTTAPKTLDRQLVRFVDGQTVDLPIVEAAQVSPDWVRSRPNLVPSPVRHELERSGHRIEQRRVFLPLILEDGQPAVVPIDEAEVQFIGERVVQ